MCGQCRPVGDGVCFSLNDIRPSESARDWEGRTELHKKTTWVCLSSEGIRNLAYLDFAYCGKAENHGKTRLDFLSAIDPPGHR